jgi:hypothetical protein
MGFGRGLSVGVLLLAVLPLLSSCSHDTPLCTYAESLVKDAQLAPAADAYGSALQAGEGRCADKGLDKVGKLQTDARTQDAKGRAAARAGRTGAARASFAAALKIDRTDAEATAELQRLGSVTPGPTPSVPTVLTAEPAGNGRGGLSWVALVIALLAVGICGYLGLAVRRRQEQIVLSGESAITRVREDFGTSLRWQSDADAEQREAAQGRVDAEIFELTERVDRSEAELDLLDRDLRKAVESLAALADRLDHSEVAGRRSVEDLGGIVLRLFKARAAAHSGQRPTEEYYLPKREEE